MAATTVARKRKSTGDSSGVVKKVKTTKSADKPAPIRSALKKPKEKRKKAPVAKVKDSKTGHASPGAEAQGEDVTENSATQLAGLDAEGDVELTEDQTAALIAGFSDSEDEAEVQDEVGVALEKLPQAPRVGEVTKRIKDATADDSEATPGVVYLGRIPHGFYESQMRAYFTQFGEISRLRLARNRKTGRSQHYGFIEFGSKAVAEIVAKTMDKYLLFGHILQVRTVPSEQIQEGFWKNSGRRKKPAPRNRLEGAKLKRGMVREDWEKRVTREEQKRLKKAEKLSEIGYEFEIPALKAVDEVPVKTRQLEDAGVV
ncbi:hypothetical protein BAUCODRAFT_32961 [Baudoinia panamericana UAMH 10762]|uniref:RRM domain-containing protein n=1 Tax=Baudoinia panamericana (strain UAMH 10762) TaxID=717646 RepID=M2MKK1_BAUPA|nr:uncharacterized protein BAUCODRAFT_32961 [Baudoinia panamericana UAMH 10762]EMC97221.1 hypothetical protein BAUCODRAFT_32961 [Baudoinia panamericana UAMH 10762]